MESDPALIERTLSEVMATLPADCGMIHLKGPSGDLELACARGPIPADLLTWLRTVPQGEGELGAVAARIEPSWPSNRLVSSKGALDLLIVPIRLGDEAIGTLAVSYPRPRIFRKQDARLLLTAGATLARRLAPPPLEALLAKLEARVDAGRMDWLRTGLSMAAQGRRAAIEEAFPAMGRRLGRESLETRSALVLPDSQTEVPLRAWRIDDAARVALLLAYPGDAEALARDLYFQGDLRERAGALRALAVVGRGTVGLDAVLDACRINAADIFEAALAENPYTSSQLPDHELRAAVMKGVFVGVSLERVEGLEARADTRLTEMLMAYVAEREAAGRSVPPDLWPVAALHPIPGLLEKLLVYLEFPSPAVRMAAGRALGRLGESKARAALELRLHQETDEPTRRVLMWALA